MRQEIIAGSASVPPACSSLDSGWRSRGYLPHYDRPYLTQMITFRLRDALPILLVAQGDKESRRQSDADRRKRFERRLDAGHGAWHLRDPRVSRMIEAAITYFDSIRYYLQAWVVMPNHVHVLIEPLGVWTVAQIIHSWKSFASKEANRILGLTGALWQREYFDRVVRDQDHFVKAVEYVHGNPMGAGLAERAEDWPFSSEANSHPRRRDGGTPALPGEMPQIVVMPTKT